MGTRGPVPKRIEERLGHMSSADKEAVERVPLTGAVVAPPVDDAWHPIALRWYESLADSGQAQFYEPSDWATAAYLAEAMSRNLHAGQRFSAQLFAAVMSGMSNLLVTEGDRRRVRLELERLPDEAVPKLALVTPIDRFSAL